MKKFRKPLFWLLIVAILLFITRIFVCQVYRVDGFHMAGTLLPGDRILVSKWKTGTRFPTTLSFVPGSERAYLNHPRVPYFRVPGFRKFQRSDLVVFNNPGSFHKPIDRRSLKVSRIVGLPGDTVFYSDKMLFVNRDTLPDPENVRLEHRVITDGRPVPDDFLREYHIQRPIVVAGIGIYDFALPEEAAVALTSRPEVTTVRPTRQFIGDPSTNYYPPSYYFMWNRDQYGPLPVPKKGDVIRLDERTIDLYRDIIERHEGNEITTDFTGIFLNGELSLNYTITKNYYFVLDDNRDRPNDSRIIGFIPEDHLLGTSRRILFSRQKEFDFLKRSQPKRLLREITN